MRFSGRRNLFFFPRPIMPFSHGILYIGRGSFATQEAVVTTVSRLPSVDKGAFMHYIDTVPERILPKKEPAVLSGSDAL